MGRNTTLAVVLGVASLLILCTLSGAIMIANSDDNSSRNTINDAIKNSIIIDESDVAESTVVYRTSETAAANYLPTETEEFESMLGDVSSDAMLTNVLMNEQFVCDGSVCKISSDADVSKYLVTTGYTAFGGYLVAEATEAQAAAEEQAAEEQTAEAQAAAEAPKLEAMSSGITFGAEVDADMIADADSFIEKRFYKICDLTVNDFMKIQWFSVEATVTEDESDEDSDAVLKDSLITTKTAALFDFIFESYDADDADKTMLDILEGTFFVVNNQTMEVKDTESLTLFLYSMGLETVATSVVTYFPVMFMTDEIREELMLEAVDEISNEKICMEMCQVDCLVGLKCNASYPIEMQYSFYELDGMTVDHFCQLIDFNCGTNFVMVETDEDSLAADDSRIPVKAMIAGQYLMQAQMLDEVQLEEFAYVTLTEDGAVEGAEFTDAAEDDDAEEEMLTALAALKGTYFVYEGEIISIQDIESFCIFLGSVGMQVNDNELVYYDWAEANRLFVTDVEDIPLFEMSEILLEHGRTAYTTSQTFEMPEVEEIQVELTDASTGFELFQSNCNNSNE